MWKKTGWFYIGVYILAILYLNILAVAKNNSFTAGSIVSLLVMLFPAGVTALELADKKVSLLVTIPALLITAVFFLGSLKFNTPGMETTLKAALFGIQLVLLVFFTSRHLFKK